MPYPNEHACRLRDPDKYQQKRRTNCTRKVKGKCLDIIYGILGAGKSEEQAYRYNKDVWQTTEARDHCQRHNGTFEAAG